MRRLIPVSLLMFMAFSPANAVPAPKIAIANFDQLAHPLPMPYNERAHAEKAVAEARAKAKKANKLLLLISVAIGALTAESWAACSISRI